jgi:hypothetical protein
MPISNGVVQSLIRNDTRHGSAVGGNYTLMAIGAQQAITTLFTIWDPLHTLTIGSISWAVAGLFIA